MNLPDWVKPAGWIVGGLGALWLIFRPKPASASSAASTGSVPSSGCSDWAGDGKAIQSAINTALAGASATGIQPANWMWPAKPSYKPGNVAVDGKPGAMTCRAAEWLVANHKATPEIASFARSKPCGCGKKRAPCGVSGPTASASVKEAIVAAGVKKGYPADQITKALSRESGWHAMALNCQGADKHPVAGGLNGMLNSVVQANGFIGTADQFAALTAEEQLPFVVSFINKMPKPSCAPRPGEFGLALFVPAYVCKPESTVIYAPGTSGWEQNPGLREGKDGPVTVGKVLSTG